MSKIKVPAYKFDENTTVEDIDFIYECISKGYSLDDLLLEKSNCFVELDEDTWSVIEVLTEGVEVDIEKLGEKDD